MTRLAELQLLPVRAYPTPVTLFARESVQAALLRIRDREEEEFPVVDRGVVQGMVRRRDLVALAASDRVNRDLE